MNSDLLYRFFQGAAKESEIIEVKRWVEARKENEERFFRERKMFDATILLKDEQELNEILDRRSIWKRSVVPFLKRAGAVAAVFAVAFCAGWFAMESVNEHRYDQMQTITVPSGQRLNLSLPDGTNVWLNSRTTIAYPVTFNKKNRTVTLDGQAYFEVAKDKNIPFMVSTDRGDVRVHGTKFDVMAYSDSDEFETVLMEGSVSVSLAADPSQRITLTPDTKASLRNGKLICMAVDNYDSYMWREGIISFTNASFGEIMREFEKSYDVHVLIENERVSGARYTGKFRVTDGVDYALRVLQQDMFFMFERDDDHKIIYIR